MGNQEVIRAEGKHPEKPEGPESLAIVDKLIALYRLAIQGVRNMLPTREKKASEYRQALEKEMLGINIEKLCSMDPRDFAYSEVCSQLIRFYTVVYAHRQVDSTQSVREKALDTFIEFIETNSPGSDVGVSLLTAFKKRVVEFEERRSRQSEPRRGGAICLNRPLLPLLPHEIETAFNRCNIALKRPDESIPDSVWHVHFNNMNHRVDPSCIDGLEGLDREQMSRLEAAFRGDPVKVTLFRRMLMRGPFSLSEFNL
mgnify:CR=1 FL=1